MMVRCGTEQDQECSVYVLQPFHPSTAVQHVEEDEYRGPNDICEANDTVRARHRYLIAATRLEQNGNGAEDDGTKDTDHSWELHLADTGANGCAGSGGESADFSGDGVDKSGTASRVDGVPEFGLTAKDGRLGETKGVWLLGLPLDVRDHDLSRAWGAEGGLGHGGLQEEEGQVGCSVGGGVWGDDCGKVVLSRGLLSRDHVQHSLREGDRGGDGDVEVVGSELDWGEVVA